MNNRKNISSGAPWEGAVGYSRAVQVGNQLEISGTVAIDDRGEVVAPGDAYGQAKFILSKISGTLSAAGFSLEDVVRTRMFVVDITRWEEIGRAHGEFFSSIRPATSMVQVSSLIGADYLVEIEAVAIKAGPSPFLV